MPSYVIADASVFIIFDKLNQMNLLKEIYQKVYTTLEIAEEFNMTGYLSNLQPINSIRTSYARK